MITRDRPLILYTECNAWSSYIAGCSRLIVGRSVGTIPREAKLDIHNMATRESGPAHNYYGRHPASLDFLAVALVAYRDLHSGRGRLSDEDTFLQSIGGLDISCGQISGIQAPEVGSASMGQHGPAEFLVKTQLAHVNPPNQHRSPVDIILDNFQIR